MYLAQLVKNPPAIRETWVWSLGWEDLLEKGKASLLSTPVFWPGEVQGLYSPRGCEELDTTEWLWLHFTSEEKKKSPTSSFTFLQLRGGVSAPSPWIWVDPNDELVTNRMKLNFQGYSEEAVWFLPDSPGTLAFEPWVVVIGWFVLSHPKFICWSTHPQYLRTWPSLEIGSLQR